MFLLQSSSNAEILKKQNNAIKICCSSEQHLIRSRRSKGIGLVAKKGVYNRAGLVDFVIVLVNSLVNLPDGQVTFFGEFKLKNICTKSCKWKKFFGLVKMTHGLLHATYSLLEWQAVNWLPLCPWLGLSSSFLDNDTKGFDSLS